jgi:hypothetical protein
MKDPTVDDVVRLKSDIPHLNLHKGDRGIVRSLWFAPATAYEVEFTLLGLDERTRAVLLREQVSMEEADDEDRAARTGRVPEADGW